MSEYDRSTPRGELEYQINLERSIEDGISRRLRQLWKLRDILDSLDQEEKALMPRVYLSAPAPVPPQAEVLDTIDGALRRERLNIEMMDLSKDHEAREFAKIDAARAWVQQQRPQQP